MIHSGFPWHCAATRVGNKEGKKGLVCLELLEVVPVKVAVKTNSLSR